MGGSIEHYKYLANRIEYKDDLPYWKDGVCKGKLAGYINTQGYRVLHSVIDGIRKLIRNNRLVWYIANGSIPELIDHINQNRADDRLSNLRASNKSLNGFNSKRRYNARSNYRGAYRNSTDTKWVARVQHNSISIHLGTFDSEEDAGKAYDNYIIQNGLQEYAVLNFKCDN